MSCLSATRITTCHNLNCYFKWENSFYVFLQGRFIGQIHIAQCSVKHFIFVFCFGDGPQIASNWGRKNRGFGIAEGCRLDALLLSTHAPMLLWTARLQTEDNSNLYSPDKCWRGLRSSVRQKGNLILFNPASGWRHRCLDRNRNGIGILAGEL